MTESEAGFEAAARALGAVYDGYVDPTDTPNNWARAVDGARAVLLAIREPSEGMKKAFVNHALHGDVLSHGGWPGYARDQWQAMIDKALEEMPQ